MDNSQLLQELFDKKVLAILKLFFKHPERQFYLLEVSKEAGVSGATTFRIVKKLSELELLKKIKVTKFKLYQLAKNDNVNFLQSFVREDIQALKLFISAIENIPGIEEVVQHGKETSTRANVLIIGDNIDGSGLKAITADIKEKYDFTISYLTLAKEQYVQMVSMGLYSGNKTILLKKK